MYNRPETIDDIINHTAGRMLDLFDIDLGIIRRWKGVADHGSDNA
jgi:4-hydroxy-3-polyprenylbenzoate decarboxylase